MGASMQIDQPTNQSTQGIGLLLMQGGINKVVLREFCDSFEIEEPSALQLLSAAEKAYQPLADEYAKRVIREAAELLDSQITGANS